MNRARMVDSVAGGMFKLIFFIPATFSIDKYTQVVIKAPPKLGNIENFIKNLENHDFRSAAAFGCWMHAYGENRPQVAQVS